MWYLVALIRADRVDEIQRVQMGVEYKWDCDRAVNITGRPDIKVGDAWPFLPVHEAIAAGHLEKAPTESDPHALRVPAPKGNS